MTTLEYLEWLETPEWWAIRQRAVKRAGYRCQRCGGCGPFEVHHLNYHHLGAETEQDIQVLCIPCHKAERLPKNLEKRIFEREGQRRLFDRWWDDNESSGWPLKAA